MKKIIRLTESDLTRLVRRVLKEQITIPLPATGEDKNTHRGNQGFQSPGFETFLADPLNDGIVIELKYELENDKFAKGKIVIIFNGAKYKNIGELIQKIQADARSGICYTITQYEYNNRVVLNTQISIEATAGKCKKEEIVNPQPDNTQPEEKPQGCYYKIKEPKDFANRVGVFQNWCIKNKKYRRRLADGTYLNDCGNVADGEWGCCSQTCYSENPPYGRIQ